MAERERPAGRVAAIVGIVVYTIALRQVMAAISPIVEQISVDVPLSTVALSVLGMLPPLVFAAFGFAGPPILRRLGIERSLVLSIVLVAAGHILRALAPDIALIIAGTVVTLAGMGIANVLLPPLVKLYFPDRIGVVTAIYACLLPLSAAMPSAVAVQLATTVGWRFSLGVWALFALAALAPWIIVLVRSRRPASVDAALLAAEVEPVALVVRVWRSRTAIAITLTFFLCAMNVYAGFTFLPRIVMELAGSTQLEAAGLLTAWSIVGVPIGFVTPILVARLRNVGWLFAAGVGFFAVGYGGLIVAPAAAPIVWVLCAGTGPLVFSSCLTLIGLRTRTHEGAVALSGFVQGIGYLLGALGPLVVGVLHDVTGAWTASLAFLLVTAFGILVSAVLLARPRYLEDELAEHAARAAQRR